MLPVLERLEQVAEEVGRLKLLHYIRLVSHVLYMLATLDLLLVDALERVHFVRRHMPHQLDRAKAAFTQEAD